MGDNRDIQDLPAPPPRGILTEDEDTALNEAIQAVLTHVLDWTFDRCAAGLQEVGSRLLSQLIGRPEAEREVRQRIAQLIQTLACSYGVPISENQRLLDELAMLGWRSLYDKVLQISAFCRQCLSQGTPALALPYLDPLIAELEQDERDGNSYPGKAQDLTMLRGLRARILGSLSPG